MIQTHTDTQLLSPQHDDLSLNKTVGECILRLEPLKIALESDDEDCSSCSSYESSDQDFLCESKDDSCINYFNKKRNREGSSDDKEGNLNLQRESLDRPLHESSCHSMPSLRADDALGNSYSNKKARHEPRRKKKSVSIHKSVSVVPIPSRLDYSDRVRERLWTAGSEIQKNAARNTIEFCSESWDWKNVLEDEHMFIHQANGERVHPIHVHNALSQIQSSEARSVEEVQLNLSLISALVPPAASRMPPLPATANSSKGEEAKVEAPSAAA